MSVLPAVGELATGGIGAGRRVGVDAGRLLSMACQPASYLIAAVEDADPDDWHDAAFLEQLVPASVKVTLVGGQKAVQSLRIARKGWRNPLRRTKSPIAAPR